VRYVGRDLSHHFGLRGRCRGPWAYYSDDRPWDFLVYKADTLRGTGIFRRFIRLDLVTDAGPLR
jgi:hypothetical protein